MTNIVGISHAVSSTTTPSNRRTASPASSFSSTPRDRQPSAASPPRTSKSAPRKYVFTSARPPIHLPEPVAALARHVAANRKGHATIGALAPSPWLFPGGQPGRPISTTQLTNRLNQLGIRPNQDRSTALFQLATELPAALLVRTLGLHIDVAVAWQRLSAGDWAAYAAEISHRPDRLTNAPAHELY